MKKWFEAALFRLGYVPVADLYQERDDADALVRSAALDRLAVVWAAEQARNHAQAVDTGRVRVIGKLLEEVAAK